LFFDANVLFSAAYRPDGTVGQFLAACRDLGWELLSSDYAVIEVERNLSRKAPQALPQLAAVLSGLRIVPSAAGAAPVPLRDKDRPILATAIACAADVLLTGDGRDFGAYFDKPGKTGGVRIMTVSAFIDDRMKPGRSPPRSASSKSGPATACRTSRAWCRPQPSWN